MRDWVVHGVLQLVQQWVSELLPFTLNLFPSPPIEVPLPTGIDTLQGGFGLVVQIEHHPEQIRYLVFRFGARGNQCSFYFATVSQGLDRRTNPGPWKELLRYDPKQPPTTQEVEQHVKKNLAEVMVELEEVVLRS